jgi:hypothetical protein
MFFLRFQAIIQKGGGTGPKKPWQPSLHNERCQFHPGKITGNDDGMHALPHVHTSLQIFSALALFFEGLLSLTGAIAAFSID